MSIGKLVTEGATATLAPWVEMVKPFWPLIWRAAVVVAIFWAGWHYGGKHAEAELDDFKVAQATATAAAVAELQREVIQREAQLADQERENIQSIYDLKLEQSQRPPRVVRVCPPADSGSMPRVSVTTGGNAFDSGGEAGLREGAGRDIGPGLDALAKRANVVLAKCINQEKRADFLAQMKPVTIPVE